MPKQQVVGTIKLRSSDSLEQVTEVLDRIAKFKDEVEALGVHVGPIDFKREDRSTEKETE